MLLRSTVTVVCLAIGASSFVISCAQHQAEAEAPATQPHGGSHVAHGAHVDEKLPSMAATQPVNLPGLHNVVAYGEDVWSGSVPEGDEGFATLEAMGVKTILTVDGAMPDLEAARQHHLRYVHLPIGYNGMDEARTLEIARVIRDLPKPMYVHCHHGKHRSAAAAGAAMVTLGKMTKEDATARMKVSGTADSYTGLYQCVNVATIASAAKLDATDGSFPETFKTTGLVKTMVDIDGANDHLKLIEKAGWTTPADHPDLVPAAEAGHLADLMRIVIDDHDVAARPTEFAQWLKKDAAAAAKLEASLVAGDQTPAQLSSQFLAIGQSCKACHVKYRD